MLLSRLFIVRDRFKAVSVHLPFILFSILKRELENKKQGRTYILTGTSAHKWKEISSSFPIFWLKRKNELFPGLYLAHLIGCLMFASEMPRFLFSDSRFKIENRMNIRYTDLHGPLIILVIYFISFFGIRDF